MGRVTANRFVRGLLVIFDGHCITKTDLEENWSNHGSATLVFYFARIVPLGFLFT
jgi:hypothetical protein